MKFEKALGEMRKGKKLTRKEWISGNFCYMHEYEDGLSIVFKVDEPAILDEDDILAEDWSVFNKKSMLEAEIKEVEDDIKRFNKHLRKLKKELKSEK